MSELVTPRGWFALCIVLIMAGTIAATGGGLGAAVLALCGGAAAVLAVVLGHEQDSPPPPPAADPREPLSAAPLAPLMEGIGDPVLILSGTRVLAANRAARALLGAHIVDEDVRTAIRHPAAASYLTRDDTTAVPGAEPVMLSGTGTTAGRWEMRVTTVQDGRRVVHLVDRSGSHAAEKMRVDFVANASHELRTPLAAILGYVETLTDAAGEDPATRQRFLKIVFDEAQRMDRLVDDLMSLSRIEADKFRAPADAVDLVALVEEVRHALAGARDGRGNDIQVEAEGAPLIVQGDRAQLSQLLHNLVGNAMKYGRPGTPIRVSLARSDDMVRLIVADEGEGIPPQHLPRLTERFYRVDAGRSRSIGGTGLGLAIVKHIVERHRGRLDIASRLGEGTRVTAILRAADDVIKP